MRSKNVILKVDAYLYEKFRIYCKKKGLIISRQFESFMENELKKYGDSMCKNERKTVYSAA
jgi:hypothetical protein